MMSKIIDTYVGKYKKTLHKTTLIIIITDSGA